MTLRLLAQWNLNGRSAYPVRSAVKASANMIQIFSFNILYCNAKANLVNHRQALPFPQVTSRGGFRVWSNRAAKRTLIIRWRNILHIFFRQSMLSNSELPITTRCRFQWLRTLAGNTRMIQVSCTSDATPMPINMQPSEENSFARFSSVAAEWSTKALANPAWLVLTVIKTFLASETLSSPRATYNHGNPNPHIPPLYIHHTSA